MLWYTAFIYGLIECEKMMPSIIIRNGLETNRNISENAEAGNQSDNGSDHPGTGHENMMQPQEE